MKNILIIITLFLWFNTVNTVLASVPFSIISHSFNQPIENRPPSIWTQGINSFDGFEKDTSVFEDIGANIRSENILGNLYDAGIHLYNRNGEKLSEESHPSLLGISPDYIQLANDNPDIREWSQRNIALAIEKRIQEKVAGIRN